VGALAGGLAFILPGLACILALSALFLAGSRAGKAGRARQVRWATYLLAGGAAAAIIGPWLVLVLLGCGLAELALRRPHGGVAGQDGLGAAAGKVRGMVMLPAFGAAAAGGGVLAGVAWVAFKVGALSFGGGFVIIPLMRADAVGRGWMTGAQFLNAVALGQITPGPVVQTVSAVGYAAAGLGGGLLAALVAFSPSFVFVLAGAGYFSVLRTSRVAQAFLDGAGPAAIGAILGSAILLAGTLREPWQFAVLAGAAVLLLGPALPVVRRGWCSPCSPRPRPGCSSRWRAGRRHIDGVRRDFPGRAG
jgi:chromate transporter